MKDRGPFRSSYEALADDPDFQDLSPLAQAVFHTLKLKLGQYGIGVFYPTVLGEYHRKSSAEELAAALRELEAQKPSGAASWIARERNVLWIRNGLRWDPLLTLANPNHQKGALRHARSLPTPALAAEFIEYYELDGADAVVSGRPKRADKSPVNRISEGQEITEKETEKETELETSSPPSSAELEQRVANALPTDADRLALTAVVRAAPAAFTWLSEMAAALNAMAGHARLTPAQLGEALRDFVGNGDLERPSFSRFRGYLRNANNPPPARRGNARARAPDPAARSRSKPTESDAEVRWQT